MSKTKFSENYGPAALVTGASSGIGTALAEELAARGIDVILTARRSDRLENLAARLHKDYSVTADFLEADLSDPHSVPKLFQAVSGRDIGLVISNAGFSVRGIHEDIPSDAINAMLAVNCQAPLLLSQLFLPQIKARGRGGFILTSSIEALIGCPMSAAYSSMKALVLHFGEALYAEAADSGIDILTCCPGATDTEAGEKSGIDLSKLSDVQQPRELAQIVIDCLGKQAVCFPNAAYKERFDKLLAMPREQALLAMAGAVKGSA